MIGVAGDALRSAFGPGCRLAGVDRLRGGSKKGVYRLTCEDDRTAVLYVWSAAENYWPDASDEGPSGIIPFSAAHARLVAAGVRVPKIYLLDTDAGVALVEDLRGGTLENLLERDPAGAVSALERLGEMLTRMREVRCEAVGAVGAPTFPAGSCERIILENAFAHLDGASSRVPSIARVRDEVGSMLRELAAAVSPRAEHVLIHGELGPDHVLLDDSGCPVLVDIEGASFFDAEWEHVFVRHRFGEHYRWLRVSGLDEHRMRLYDLALDLSLVEGPLRLLDGDFPDREFMLGIADHAAARVLARLGP